MGCTCCCNRAYASCKKTMEPLWATLKCLENIPIVGHLLAAFYIFLGDKDKGRKICLEGYIWHYLGNIKFSGRNSRRSNQNTIEENYSRFPCHQNQTGWRSIIDGPYVTYVCLDLINLVHISWKENWNQYLWLRVGLAAKSLSVEQQLMGGIRFLDFRLMTDPTDKEVWLHHNMVTCEKFRYILDTIPGFHHGISVRNCVHISI